MVSPYLVRSFIRSLLLPLIYIVKLPICPVIQITYECIFSPNPSNIWPHQKLVQIKSLLAFCYHSAQWRQIVCFVSGAHVIEKLCFRISQEDLCPETTNRSTLDNLQIILSVLKLFFQSCNANFYSDSKLKT